MIISVQIEGQSVEIDTSGPLDISIPLRFDGGQPNAYGVDPAVSQPCRTGDLTGDTRHGGSCNFEEYKLIPHCHGTHTEGIGHITYERIPVRNCLKDPFSIARLITVKPEKALETADSYPVDLDQDDLLITKQAISRALENPQPRIQKPKSLIVRTMPNDGSKLTRQYLKDVPPFFSNEAVAYIVGIGISHLLVDLPSVDRMFDEGKLSNHRIFWNVGDGSFEASDASRTSNTITEMIFVPDSIKDGDYLLNLQITAFETDASPSRPLLFTMLRR